MADAQILAGGVEAAPLAYTVPNAQEIILKAAFATFDGSGAGAAFLPCVRIISSGNKIVGEYITDSSVAAGSSAEVSFAPFLRNAGSAAAAVLSYAVYNQSGATGGTSQWGSVTTNDAATFSIDSGDSTLAVIAAQGVYQVTVVARVSILASPYTILSNQYISAVDTVSGSTVVSETLIVKGQTDSTLPHANSVLATSAQLYGFAPNVAPYKLRASHSPPEANVSVPVALEIVKVA